ncbi:MAG: hypothetical protein QW232_09575 [Saccharolobus sp.]
MYTLRLLSKYPSMANVVDSINKYSKDLDLIPTIHAYFEDEIIRNVVKSLDPKVKSIYEEFKFDRTLFIKNALRVLGISEEDLQYYPYYSIPISDETIVSFVDNSTIPPKVLVINGTVRFTFMAYSSYAELESRVASREDEDIVIEFENGKVKSHNRKRNIFTDANVVTKILTSNKAVLLNLVLPGKYYLISSLLSMNTIPYKNKVLIKRNGENLEFKILEGKASYNQIINGETLNPRFKLEIYYDYRSKKIIKDEMAKALSDKIPL